MSDATFQTFLTSGLLVLTASIGYLAWSAWRWIDRARDMEKAALVGVGYELRMNLTRMINELAGVESGAVTSEIQLVPVVHPQLDGVLSRPNEADRESLTMMLGNYNELSAHKQTLRAALGGQGDVAAAANVGVDAVIGSIATLYLWEEHKGAAPKVARSTRSWDVRDWMKANDFRSDMLPGLHLRDEVVERLRTLGMVLTPKPLTHTASEFYAMQYDRKADPNAPFWKRKAKPVMAEGPEGAADVAADAAPEPQPEPEPMPEPTPEPELVQEAAPEPVTEPAPEPVEAAPEPAEQIADPDPAPAEPDPAPADAASSDPVDADADAEAGDAADEKPATPGVVH